MIVTNTTAHDELVVDPPRLRAFFPEVNRIRNEREDPNGTIAAIPPCFAALLATKTLLPPVSEAKVSR